jgi:hypothetical protein
MKLRYLGLALVLVLTVISYSAKAQTRSSESWRRAKPKTVTLFSRAKHQPNSNEYGKSAFSFNHGVRSDAGPRITRNNYELLYGSIRLNGDSDWFSVTMVTDDRSRIKDLGELNWSDPFDVPYITASLQPNNGIRLPAKAESFEQSSNGQVTRVVAGHMYVLHSKDSDTDLYTLFRVEKLVPSDEVTISWKVVRRRNPAPKRFPEPGLLDPPSVFRSPPSML